MIPTYKSLLETLLAFRDGNYRSDPERHDATNTGMIYVLRVMLEKLAADEEGA